MIFGVGEWESGSMTIALLLGVFIGALSFALLTSITLYLLLDGYSDIILDNLEIVIPWGTLA